MNIETAIVLFTGLCLFSWIISLICRKIYKIDGVVIKIVEFFSSLLPLMLLVLLLRSFIAENFLIPSGSMKPSLLEGDLIIVSKYDYGIRLPVTGDRLLGQGSPKRGDIVVFRSKALNKNVIKRVIGLPGDKINYANNKLYINDMAVEQKFINQEIDVEINGNNMWLVDKKCEKLSDSCEHFVYNRKQPEYQIPGSAFKYNNLTVPLNSYFVMGDNRDFSQDSRFIGFISDKELIGKAVLIWMSWDPNSNSLLSSIRWGRLFNYVK